MDNSAHFSRAEISETRLQVGDRFSDPTPKLDKSYSGSELVRSVSSDLPRLISAVELSLPEPHSRSDSGLSSLSSWTVGSSSGGSSSAGTRSGSSSVRSSSIVSNSSARLEELLGAGKRSSSIVSSCSMRLEELEEVDESQGRRDSRVLEKVKYFQGPAGTRDALSSSSEELEPSPELEPELELSQTCKETGVQRQLATIKQQKEKLIKEIVENEEVGMALLRRLETELPGRELERVEVFLSELEKVVLLLLSICSRLERAEEELNCGNLTDWEKESIRWVALKPLVLVGTISFSRVSCEGRRKKRNFAREHFHSLFPQMLEDAKVVVF